MRCSAVLSAFWSAAVALSCGASPYFVACSGIEAFEIAGQLQSGHWQQYRSQTAASSLAPATSLSALCLWSTLLACALLGLPEAPTHIQRGATLCWCCNTLNHACCFRQRCFAFKRVVAIRER
ncbi:hypothetical protein ABBQ32_004947 [Trebouxia sp. C0010 RCD-2024]